MCKLRCHIDPHTTYAKSFDVKHKVIYSALNKCGQSSSIRPSLLSSHPYYLRKPEVAIASGLTGTILERRPTCQGPIKIIRFI